MAVYKNRCYRCNRSIRSTGLYTQGRSSISIRSNDNITINLTERIPGQKNKGANKNKNKNRNKNRNGAASNGKKVSTRGVLVKARRNALASGQRLSECATKYLLACTKASSRLANGACVPCFPVMDSMKTKGFVRGTMVVGVGGVGVVCIAPSLANDRFSGWYTDGNYANSVVPQDETVLGVHGFSCSNLPVNYGNLITNTIQNQAAGRIVGGELTLEYTGAALYRRGMSYAYSDRQHQSIEGLTVAQIGTRQNCSVRKISDEKIGISFCAVRPSEIAYPENNLVEPVAENALNKTYPFCYENTSQSTEVGSPIAAIMVTGEVGDQYHFEYHIHVEYVGNLVQARVSPSHLDSSGFEKVNTAVNSSTDSSTNDPYTAAKSFLSRNGVSVDSVARGAGAGLRMYNSFAQGFNGMMIGS